VLPRSVSSAPIAAPATATPLKIAAAPHLPRAFCSGFTTGASGTIGRAEAGRGVLRLVERGFGTGFGTAFRGVDSADDFASDMGLTGVGFDGATGLAVEVARGTAPGDGLFAVRLGWVGVGHGYAPSEMIADA
jgi:hypothetical protein